MVFFDLFAVSFAKILICRLQDVPAADEAPFCRVIASDIAHLVMDAFPALVAEKVMDGTEHVFFAGKAVFRQSIVLEVSCDPQQFPSLLSLNRCGHIDPSRSFDHT